MKALTICQPYAEMIVRGEKRVENRTWPTKYRGLLYIHAGKNRGWWDDAIDPVRYPAAEWGALVAIANLVECTSLGTIQTGLLDNEYPWIHGHTHVLGPWCWILDSVRRIKPLPWRGAQGIWDCAAVTETFSHQTGDNS